MSWFKKKEKLEYNRKTCPFCGEGKLRPDVRGDTCDTCQGKYVNAEHTEYANNNRSAVVDPSYIYPELFVTEQSKIKFCMECGAGVTSTGQCTNFECVTNK